MIEPKTTPYPAWFGNARMSVARDERGAIIGVELLCLIPHDRIPDLPGLMPELAHGTIDKAAEEDARHG